MSDQAFQALADERRRDILRLIQNTELSAGEIAGHFDITQPAISQHLRVLVEAQLVTMRRQGTHRLYRARPEGLVQVREYLEGFWDASLQELKQAAEMEARGIKPYGRN
jgi:DNA-binding transcriptional ArsR family regulator